MRTPPPGAPGPAGSADSPQWAKESPNSSLASSPSHAEPGWPLHSPSGEEPSVPTLPGGGLREVSSHLRNTVL